MGNLVIFRIGCADAVDFLPKLGRFPILTCPVFSAGQTKNQEVSWAPGLGDKAVRLSLDQGVSRHVVGLMFTRVNHIKYDSKNMSNMQPTASI